MVYKLSILEQNILEIKIGKLQEDILNILKIKN